MDNFVTKFKKQLLWLGALVLLIHYQINDHRFIAFIIVSMVVGLIPIQKVKWFHFAMLHLVVLGVSLAMLKPNQEITHLFEEISKIKQPIYTLIAVIYTTLCGTLASITSYNWVTEKFILKQSME
jgi:hypothetical protein